MAGQLMKPCEQPGCPIWTPHIHLHTGTTTTITVV